MLRKGLLTANVSHNCKLFASKRHSHKTAVCSLPADYDSRLKGLKVLVAGATGRTGKQVVEVLQQAGVPVRALVRDTTKAGKLLPSGPGVEVVQGDVFQYSSLPAALGDANAIIVTTGASDVTDPLGPFNVDYQGTVNLVALAKQKGIKKFVLVTSIGADETFNPLNLFWGVLFWKKRAEEELQRSGLDYTIVRPGGLKDSVKDGGRPGAIVMRGPGFYGVNPLNRMAEPAGAILRKQVAEVCVAALTEADAQHKVVEIVAKEEAVERSYADLFKSVT
ncbi:hypothetical protein CEUSTIGMA_g7458.t1 [Chlamydomonas eustigma]|uniref:NAD(P)-binding domain-containing protein n=1 Tax=Chlamydomonas eustigma TaxID=1157962 RepID=A0A250XAV8_9CHLO|nr:hypothetical protein CEUSTIGMA_g7458.t1 [Chlamydomonas eustigma]|eukprot:GAX80019.1 hypothetical protein CEUSTIGMA_g7458.t1 [Chlamydomonas eustigma]